MKNLTALKITIAYLVFGILWILFSDFLVKEYTSVPDLYFFLETSKGLLFVLLSALLVYLLSRRLLKKELSTIDEEKSKIVDNLINKSIHFTTYGTDNEKGSGLGFQLCKEFVSLNSGHIWIESTEGTGSSFYVNLPVKSALSVQGQ